MSGALSPKPHQEAITAENLRSYVARMEEALKSAHEALKSAAVEVNMVGIKAAKSTAIDSIEDLVKETERLRVHIDQVDLIFVSHDDDYMAEAMRAIVPKLPLLIESKRGALLESDLEQFVASVMPSDPLRDVLLDVESDNIALREQFVKSHKCFDSKTIALNAGYKGGNLAHTAWRWKSKGQVFSVDYFGRELFPAFQFRDGKPLPAIKKILDVVGKDLSPWQVAFWFVAENGWLDGERPLDMMLRSEDEVIEAAKRAVERAEY